MPRFGTVPSLLFAASRLSRRTAAFAATKEPPYEAVVESDEAFARCGPGKNFYPTAKLKRGDHVTVRRHDPGGWFMIDPPPGSFSLIQSEDVSARGTSAPSNRWPTDNRPSASAAAIDPTIDSVYQRQLSSGERVEILGEATVPHRGSPGSNAQDPVPQRGVSLDRRHEPHSGRSTAPRSANPRSAGETPAEQGSGGRGSLRLVVTVSESCERVTVR